MNQMKLLYIYSSDFEQDKLKKLHKKIFDGEKEIGKVFQTFKKNKDKTAFIKSLQGLSNFFGTPSFFLIKLCFRYIQIGFFAS